MSGHSKWSQIKRQKGVADLKRGQVFGKLTNAIISAARTGGDPNTNFTLKMAIEKARSADMPKENIERAIKRGNGELGGAQIQDVLYEVIGPQNIGIMIEAVSDNKNRTTSEIKNALNKFGAKLADPGAVAYQFEKMGKLLVDLENADRENIELVAIDAGAEDFEEQDESLAVYTKPHELEIVKKAFEEKGLVLKETNLTWEPKNLITISDESVAQKILALMEALDNLDDVTAIHANFDLLSTLEAGLPKEII